MLDLADLARGSGREIAMVTRTTRVKRLTASIVVFAAGCALAALLYARVSEWCFCMLPIFGVATLMMRAEVATADSKTT